MKLGSFDPRRDGKRNQVRNAPVLAVPLELEDSRQELFRDHESARDAVLDESELAEKGARSFVIKIHFSIVDGQKVEPIRLGQSPLYIKLANKTGDEV